MTRDELHQKYWKYYLMMEKQFIDSIEYVEPHQDNFATFSNRYTHMIQSIGSEIDVVLKEFCGFNTNDRKNIKDYAEHILQKYPDLPNHRISVSTYNIEFKPFEGWTKQKPAESLSWWQAFTSIKHNRYEQMHQANLKNTLYALGALCLLENLYLTEIVKNTTEFDVFNIPSSLFIFKDLKQKWSNYNGIFFQSE